MTKLTDWLVIFSTRGLGVRACGEQRGADRDEGRPSRLVARLCAELREGRETLADLAPGRAYHQRGLRLFNSAAWTFPRPVLGCIDADLASKYANAYSSTLFKFYKTISLSL